MIGILVLVLCAANFLEACELDDCGERCLSTIADAQWGTDAINIEELRKGIQSLSLYHIDIGYWAEDTLEPDAYDQTSEVYLCRNDPLWVKFYSTRPNVDANVEMGNILYDPDNADEDDIDYEPNIYENGAKDPGKKYMTCRLGITKIDLSKFKDSRYTDNHGSNSLSIIIGKPHEWDDGFTGFLPTLAPNVLPKVIYYNDPSTLEGVYFTTAFFQDILNKLQTDKSTIIVSVGTGWDYKSTNPDTELEAQMQYYLTENEFFEFYAKWGDLIFAAGGLLIGPVNNVIAGGQPFPAANIQSIGVGAVDYNTGVTWAGAVVGQSINPTLQGFLKPNIQGYSNFCLRDQNHFSGVGCSASAPTVTAAAMAMHSLLLSHENLLVGAIASVQHRDHFNGLIAAWLINSGKLTPQDAAYDPDKTGVSLWEAPFKQFFPRTGKFMFFSSAFPASQTMTVPLFTIPKDYIDCQKEGPITLKFTVYFRATTPVPVAGFNGFPFVSLFYLTPNDERTDFVSDLLADKIVQGKHPYITFKYTGDRTKPGTFYIRVSSNEMDKLYVASYLDIPSRADTLFFPSTPMIPPTDNPTEATIFEDIRTLYGFAHENGGEAVLLHLRAKNKAALKSNVEKRVRA